MEGGLESTTPPSNPCRVKFFTTSGTHIFAYGSLILLQLPQHLLVLILKGKNTGSSLLTLRVGGLTFLNHKNHEHKREVLFFSNYLQTSLLRFFLDIMKLLKSLIFLLWIYKFLCHWQTNNCLLRCNANLNKIYFCHCKINRIHFFCSQYMF